MDVIKAARELGKAIQADERYIEYAAAKKANDEDIELQGLIGKLNILQMSYQNESEKENSDEKKLEQWDADFRKTYTEVMLTPKMRECVNGADPETAEPVQADGGGCTGSCSTCGGCG